GGETAVGRIYAYSQDCTFRTHISAGGRESDGEREEGSESGKGKGKGDAREETTGGWKWGFLRRKRRTLSGRVGDGRHDSTEEIVTGKDREANGDRDRNLEMRDMDSEVSDSVGGVYQETTFEITHEEADEEFQGRSYQSHH
ncbi:hypothetical protein BJY04DRAFT_224465, partial [Aspergillus karnatakaensis]|uniref:uncharacterized protein n=1 Tax=Aspergillus karnatakaensis TaxID=1810916 RepID=UPI003CCD4A54